MRVCEVIGEVGEWRTADRSEKAAKAGPAPRVNLVLLNYIEAPNVLLMQ